ncbi:DUF1697 domain-containing protein [Erythrobacter sp. MTPC3]|uniref:DUF1697 domain-containing protein n=1 Tax=Erythrobacter sp. MTPC3 TaxID=3056564 RepID=UPI0036F20946
MARYLALLGSINVRSNRIKMADLKAALADAGFQDITTIAASGNVVFSDERDPALLEIQFESIIEQRFEFQSCTMIRTADEVRTAIDGNPFHGTEARHGSDKMVHTVFLSQPADRDAFHDLISDHDGPERLALGDRMLFLDYVDGVGTSKLTNRLLERKLGCKGTARNMNSLKNILSKMN